MPAGSFGVRAAEKRLDERTAFAIAEEGFLAALLQPVERGPDWMRLHEGLQSLEAGFTRKAPQRDPFKGRLDNFVFCGCRRAVASRKVVGLIKRDRLGKAGQVAFLLRREVRREHASLRCRLGDRLGAIALARTSRIAGRRWSRGIALRGEREGNGRRLLAATGHEARVLPRGPSRGEGTNRYSADSRDAPETKLLCEHGSSNPTKRRGNEQT